MKRKVLVVDDEQVMLILARRTLSTKYEIVTAKDGREAIEIFEKEKPDLVLSDLRMPEIDGYELHRILQEKSSEPVPIIFMTADDRDDSESKGFAAGAADYIRKPWKPDVLLRRVENIIDNINQIHGLKAVASTDPMTGLLNKSSSQKEIGELIKKSAGALLIIDLDSFKLVNDIHGHSMGDRILIRFSELVKQIIRTEDLAGRVGGDEFIVYLQNVGEEKILHDKTDFLNEQILIAAKEFMGADFEIPLGVSVGAVFSPDEGTDFSELYKKADSALYDVKQHGKHGCSVYGKKNHSDAGNSEVEKLSRTRMILGERNIEPGAYFVDFENFKTVYRFLTRLSGHYGKGLQLVQLTVSPEKSVDEFKDVLVKTLRKSDCVTRRGNKFLLLLPGVAEEDSAKVKERIFSQLENFSEDDVTFENEKIF